MTALLWTRPSTRGDARGRVQDEEHRSPILAAGSTRARAFDLLRQETVERSRLRRLQPLLETIAHRFGSALTSAIRQPAHVEVISFEQRTWEEHSSGLPDPTFVSSAVLLPLEGRVVIHLPVDLVFTLIDFYLGGDALAEPERNQLTEIERALIGGVIDLVWNEIPPPLTSIIALTVGMVQNSSSPLLVQVGRPGVMCLVVELHVSVGDREPATVSIAMPFTVLLPVLEHIERQQSSEGLDARIDRRQARQRILAVPLELKVAYPPITMTPGELLSLRVGDVVRIDQEQSDGPSELELVVQDVKFGTGALVENGSKLACTVITKKERIDD